MQPLQGDSTSINEAGVKGTNTVQDGRGVYGESMQGVGVWGYSKSSKGVIGASIQSNGIYGDSQETDGVYGISHSSQHSGIAGVNEMGGNGVYGNGKGNNGVLGISRSDGHAGVAGVNEEGNGDGVYGRSKSGNGVNGSSSSPEHAGVAGVNDNPNGAGIYGKGGRVAAYFEGDVEVTGDIRLTNADLAEDFTVFDNTEPGEVMVLTEDGTLVQSTKEYDKKVVGVISGAGKYKPGIILDKQGKVENRKPIAIMGKVYCKVDASSCSIETGDMLTTSNIPGFAMKATDSFKAFGAVIGKALASLSEGKGLIPILVVLQ